jgi:hypothetical protein
VFIEHNVDAAASNRYTRWWAAYGGGGSVTLPLVMADSGHQVSNGYEDFETVYAAMVDAELARPAQAEIEAYSRRIGDKLRFYIELTNLSGVALSGSNWAAIHAVVYEDAQVSCTDRYVRAAPWEYVSPGLAHGASMTLTLETADLSGVVWDNLHSVVMVDYRPGGSSGPYDMLQAAYAQPVTITVTPDPLTFLVDPSDPPNPYRAVTLQGPYNLSWSATPGQAWLGISPASGAIGTSPVVSVASGLLSAGWQQGYITYTGSSGDGISVTGRGVVQVYYGQLERVYLPLVLR